MKGTLIKIKKISSPTLLFFGHEKKLASTFVFHYIMLFGFYAFIFLYFCLFKYGKNNSKLSMKQLAIIFLKSTKEM